MCSLPDMLGFESAQKHEHIITISTYTLNSQIFGLNLILGICVLREHRTAKRLNIYLG